MVPPLYWDDSIIHEIMGVFDGGIASIFIGGVTALLLVICIVCIVCINSHKAKSKAVGRTAAPFWIENEILVINNAMSKQYPLSEISHIYLGCSKAIGRYQSSGTAGYFRIVKKDGKRSIKYLFDGSVYTEKYQFLSTKKEIIKSIDLIEKELLAAGVRCKRIE